jgi:hypothetical protein
MASKQISKEQVQKVIDACKATGWPSITLVEAAKRMGTPRGTLDQYINVFAPRHGITLPSKSDPVFSAGAPAEDELRHQIATLKTQLTAYQKDELTARYVRSKIMGLAETTPTPPVWLVENKASKSSPGVPTLFCSDLHWGEVVDPRQINGVNEYNLNVAHTRMSTLVTRAIDLLNNHVVNPKYPGLVLALGGDMVSGSIHEELEQTNDVPLLPSVLDLLDVMTWGISTLADAFGRIHIPAVAGNHGRLHHKVRAKDFAHTNLDWLLYCLLEKNFAKDKRVTFQIPDGPDAQYRIYSHRYLLSHGNQFRGGDGLIGALGPIIRGDHKKRSRNNQIAMGYDTMLLGHFHQLIQLERVIVNGSLKGYDEYAWANNFAFERPRQALFITHPVHGITISMPVNVDDSAKQEGAPWVSVK